MRRFISLPILLAATVLRAQSADPGRSTTAAFLVEVHQITPGQGLRDVNNRSGWGGMLGFEVGGEIFGVRGVAEAGIVPTQQADPANPGQSYETIAWGGGIDGLAHMGRRDLNVYALVGIHVDNWQTTVTYDSTGTSSSSTSGHLGFRAGVGLNAGPFFAEARYRITEGDLRVPSDQSGARGSWSAVEFGAGLRLRF